MAKTNKKLKRVKLPPIPVEEDGYSPDNEDGIDGIYGANGGPGVPGVVYDKKTGTFVRVSDILKKKEEFASKDELGWHGDRPGNGNKWNFRIIERDGIYAVHEVYYNQDGVPDSVSEDPVSPYGDSLVLYANASALPALSWNYFLEREKRKALSAKENEVGPGEEV